MQLSVRLLCSALIAGSVFLGAAAGPAKGQGLYPKAELEKDRARLSRAVTKIFEIGLKPHLKPAELRGLGKVELVFPMPRPDDDVLNFYAGRVEGTATVVLPVQSMKLLEDLTTAFAWLYVEKRGFGPLDLYFSMMRHKPEKAWGPQGPRPILQALGVPANVLKNPKVDKLALGLRNEAYAFLMMHELGHVLFEHKPVSDITPAQARADEKQSDAFALEVLARASTPPMGAVLFFQAQIYALPHRGEFKSNKAWSEYLDTASTHPLSADRIRAMSQMMWRALPRGRPAEAGIWRDIGRRLETMVETLEDVELHNCLVKVAQKSPLSLLRSDQSAEHGEMRRLCLAK